MLIKNDKGAVKSLVVLLPIFLGILILAYLIGARHNFRVDLTENKVFSLSPETKEVLNELGDTDITVYAFFSENQPGKLAFENLLESFSQENRRIKYRFFDPDKNPGKARKYKIESYGETIIKSEARQEKITNITEEDVTNALFRIIRDEKKNVYFTSGHGEHDILNGDRDGYLFLNRQLYEENYIIKELVLLREGIPTDCDTLVVAGPKNDFVAEEIKILKDYIDSGGKAVFLIDPPVQGETPNLATLLLAYGINLGSDVIVDKLGKLFGSDYLIPMITQYSDHTITKNFNLASFMPLVRSVSVTSDLPKDVKPELLAFTSDGSWAETDFVQLEEGKAVFDDVRDSRGPISVACVSTKKVVGEGDEEQGSAGLAASENSEVFRIIVVGDSDFASNSNFNLSGNKDLILNMIAWSAGEKSLVTIRPRLRESTPLLLKTSQQNFLFVVPVILMPLGSLIFGTIVFFNRRRCY